MSEELIRRSAELDEEIAGSSAVRELERGLRRSRHVMWLLGLSLALDVGLTGWLIVQDWQTQQLAARADSLQRQAYITCLAANENAAGQRALWGPLLAIPAPSPQTTEQQEQRAAFQHTLDTVYAPQRCSP